MLELTITHTLNCSKARFWELFFDPDFTRQLLLDGLGFGSCEIGPVETDAGQRRRRMEVVPKLELPTAVAKALGKRLGYREAGVFDEASETWSYDIRMNTLGDRIRLGGRFDVVEAGPDACTRRSVLWVEAKVLGIGGIIEKAAEKNMRDGWDLSAEWINRWLQSAPGQRTGNYAES